MKDDDLSSFTENLENLSAFLNELPGVDVVQDLFGEAIIPPKDEGEQEVSADAADDIDLLFGELPPVAETSGADDAETEDLQSAELDSHINVPIPLDSLDTNKNFAKTNDAYSVEETEDLQSRVSSSNPATKEILSAPGIPREQAKTVAAAPNIAQPKPGTSSQRGLSFTKISKTNLCFGNVTRLREAFPQLQDPNVKCVTLDSLEAPSTDEIQEIPAGAVVLAENFGEYYVVENFHLSDSEEAEPS